MSDLLTDARETLSDISSRRPGQTHYDGCRTEHVGCLLADLVEEVERLRLAIRRLAEQDATLSVCDGAVTVTMDATLTKAEREAILIAAGAYDLDSGDAECEAIAATLLGLLERQTPPEHTTPTECTVRTECTSRTDTEPFTTE